MPFDSQAYGAAVAAILALGGDGERPMPLAGGRCSSETARARIRESKASDLFPGARAPEAAVAGLYVYFSCWEEAHQTAQDISGTEGSYWHAIVHRQEPDAGNSAYWFHRVGRRHAIFPALREAAIEAGVDCGPTWDSIAFIDYCERARQEHGARETAAERVQLAEWQLLFDYCARPA
ncbi:MAG TPA: hypothetical protein VG675_19375 [Bryobacteraceae bacterium]|nr:hypothetical protein [Bryobacteraceae bacterium]